MLSRKPIFRDAPENWSAERLFALGFCKCSEEGKGFCPREAKEEKEKCAVCPSSAKLDFARGETSGGCEERKGGRTKLNN